MRLLLGAGEFSWENTVQTLNTVGLFAIGLPFQAIIPLYLRGFYSLKNTKKPLYSTFFAMLLNVVLSLILTKYLGVAGLALSFSLTSIGHFLILSYLFKGEIEGFSLKINDTLIKIFLASLLAGGVAYGSLRFFEPLFVTNTFLGLFWQTLFSSIMGVGLYGALTYLMKMEELKSLGKLLNIGKILGNRK